MRGVGRETGDALDGCLQASEHFVPCLGEPLQLVTGPADREAVREVLDTDLHGGARQLVDGRERPAADPVAAAERDGDHEGDGDQQQRAKLRQHPIDVGEAGGGLDFENPALHGDALGIGAVAPAERGRAREQIGPGIVADAEKCASGRRAGVLL